MPPDATGHLCLSEQLSHRVHENKLDLRCDAGGKSGIGFYPPERTLLATGVIEAVMDSAFQNGRKVETPHLDVRYRAQRESRFMRGPLPPYDRVRR